MREKRTQGVTSELATAIKDFGFPIVAAMGLGYFVFYVWKWVTTEIKPVIGEANSTLIKLVDRIRMLDNDMIRLNTKLAMVLEHRQSFDKSLTDNQRNELDEIVSKYVSVNKGFDSTGNAPQPKEESKK